MRSYTVEVMLSNSPSVYHMQSLDYLKSGDIVTFSGNGILKKAGKGDKVIGIATETHLPSGVLAVWGEHEL